MRIPNIKSCRAHLFPIILIVSIVAGGLVGYYCGEFTVKLKPLGEIFLNLLFVAVVPVIFFSVSSAVAQSASNKKFGRLFLVMGLVFIATGVVAALFMLAAVTLFPPAQHSTVMLVKPETIANFDISNQLSTIFSVNNFPELFSHHHMLALIIFSILVGIAAAQCDQQGKNFMALLKSGEAVFMRVFSLVMYYAPIGFFAYFAVLMHEVGTSLLDSYLQVTEVYYGFALIYFIFGYSAFAYLAGKKPAIKRFWNNLFLPAITALATCSGAASIPANLLACKAMGVAPQTYETVIPLGSIIHKDGSVLGGMVKIAFLFGIFHIPFSGFSVLLTAIVVSILVGTVMGAIPSGGMLGELLILNIYGFPPSSLMIIAAISIIIDPMATLLNVTGNTVSSLLIDRFVSTKVPR